MSSLQQGQNNTLPIWNLKISPQKSWSAQIHRLELNERSFPHNLHTLSWHRVLMSLMLRFQRPQGSSQEGGTGVAKSKHANSSTEWQLTAGKETKTIQKAHLPRTAHFKVLLYSRIHMQWGEDLTHIPLSLQIISSALNTLVVRQRTPGLEKTSIITGFNALISWTPGTRPILQSVSGWA